MTKQIYKFNWEDDFESDGHYINWRCPKCKNMNYESFIESEDFVDQENIETTIECSECKSSFSVKIKGELLFSGYEFELTEK